MMKNQNTAQTVSNRWTGVFVLLAILVSFRAHAQLSVQTPPEIESQAQTVEGKFNSALAEECSSQLCAPAGCQVLRFKTIDQKQNSSLPGLDESDEDETVASSLQYKLDAIRCEFTFEPTLSDEAVTSLRQRLQAKVAPAGLTLAVNPRKLAPANAILKNGAMPPKAADVPEKTESGLTAAFHKAVPVLLIIALSTLSLLSLIWGLRRLGKPKPLTPVAEPVAADETAPVAPPEKLEPALEAQRAQILEAFAADTTLSQRTFEPLIASGNAQEISRVLAQFGPAVLESFAREPRHQALFAEVRRLFQEGLATESSENLGRFFQKIDRLVVLAKLGRSAPTSADEFEFVQDLSAADFAKLAQTLTPDEQMTILSFVPERLRAEVLRQGGAVMAEAYAWHVMHHPRVPDQTLRDLARKLKTDLETRGAEIRSVSQDQVGLIQQLLNTLPREARSKIVTRLKVEQPGLFSQILSGTLLERAVASLPDGILNDIFLSLTPVEGAQYLDMHQDREKILAKLKPTLATALRAAGGTAKPFGLDLDFVEASGTDTLHAREKFNDAVMRKAAKGEIDLRRLNETVAESL